LIPVFRFLPAASNPAVTANHQNQGKILQWAR